MTENRRGPTSPDGTPTTNLATENGICRPLPDSTPSPNVLLQGYPEHRAWLRAQFVSRLRSRRRISRELDSLFGAGRPDLVLFENREPGGDYWADTGMSLGIPERRAAGLAMVEWVEWVDAA